MNWPKKDEPLEGWTDAMFDAFAYLMCLCVSSITAILTYYRQWWWLFSVLAGIVVNLSIASYRLYAGSRADVEERFW